jgi:CheY-like chemotaxis protein
MPDPGLPPSAELHDSQDHFIAELASRIEVLRDGAHRINEAENPTAEVYAVKRRLHALATAARVLGFARAAAALDHAELSLSQVTGVGAGPIARPALNVSVTPALLAELDHVLDALPTLVVGGDVALPALGDLALRSHSPAPLCLVLHGGTNTVAGLKDPSDPWASLLELHPSEGGDELVRACALLGPDVVLFDGSAGEVAELVPRVREALGGVPALLVARVGFQRHAELRALIELGVARVLPRPVPVALLRRVLRQATRREPKPLPAGVEALRTLTPDALAALIGEEARRVLVPGSERDAADKASADARASERAAPRIDFGDGCEPLAELWSTLARLRELSEHHAGGALHLPPAGPEGSIVVAPTQLEPDAARDADHRSALAERRILVATGDAELARFLSDELEAAGALVLSATDGRAALGLARRTWPDAIVSDVRLPELDGFALCRRIKHDIALGDVPVLLLAWRSELETLARRASQARAGEPPGAAPPAGAFTPHGLLRDLARALAPRAALERRLNREEPVHGRLDGMNARSLLQLACRQGKDAALRLENAGLVFELELEAGRLVGARLHDGTGEVARGEAVLSPLLGAHGARFSLTPPEGAPERHFDAELMSVLEPSLRRARAAERALSLEPLVRVERVVLDPHAVTQCLFASSSAVRSLVTQLMDGLPPRALSLKAYATREPLEVVVAATVRELCLGGAVLAVLDAAGNDRLARELEQDDARARPAPPSAQEAPRLVPLATRSIPPRESETPSEAATPAPSASETRDEAASLPPGVAERAPAEIELGDAVLAALAVDESPAETPAPPSIEDPSAWRTPPGPTTSPLTPLPSVSAPRQTTPTGGYAAYEPSREATPAPMSADEPEANGDTAAHDSAAEDTGADEARDAEPSPATEAAALVPVPPAAPLPRLRERVTAVLVPFAITLAAGTIAYFALSRLGVGAPDVPPPTTAIQAQLPFAHLRPPSPDAGAAHAPAAARPVEFESEELAVPPEIKLKPGHGLLEIHTWRRQRLYVDGVFVGNYASRRVPLNAGNYEVRLLDGARALVRSVQVRAGQRTLLRVSKQTAP